MVLPAHTGAWCKALCSQRVFSGALGLDGFHESCQAKRAAVMRVPLVFIVLSSAGGAALAQSANEGPKGVQACFKAARVAQATCSEPATDQGQRLECLRKMRANLLDCLERAPPDVSPASPPGTSPSGTPAEAPAGTPPPPQKSTAAMQPKSPEANWIFSRTFSPSGHALLAAATIRLPYSIKDVPNVLMLRCRGQRFQLLVRANEGTLHPSRDGEVQVGYQVDDRPLVRSLWIASIDRKAAAYKGNTVGLLQSLPDGASLKINVMDGQGRNREATFHLDGLDATRKKVAAACKRGPPAHRLSSEGRVPRQKQRQRLPSERLQ